MTALTDNAVGIRRRRWALTGLAIIVLAAASLEGFVLPALPRLQRDFGVDAAIGALASVVPTVITVIVTPLAGRLADVHGAGRTLAGLLAIVITGGLTSAFAPDFALFIVGQALQGFALGIIPVGFVVLRHLFRPESIKTASGVLVAMSVAGAGLGVLTAGPIIEATSRAVLYAVPTAVVALGGIVFFAARPGLQRRDPDAPTGVDWLGAGVFAVALVVLVVALGSSSSAGWLAPGTLALFAAAVGLIAVWVWIENRVAQPMIDVSSLRSRSVGGAVAVGVAIGAGYAPIVFLLPQLVSQPAETGYGLGASASEIGLFLAVAYGAGVVSSVVAGRVAQRLGLRLVGVLAMATLGIGAVTTVFSPAVGFLIVSLFLAGIGAAAASTVVYASAAIGADAHEVGVSTALITIARAVGGALATQIVASIITSAAPTFGVFQLAFAVTAVLALGGAGIALWLLPRDRVGAQLVH